MIVRTASRVRSARAAAGVVVALLLAGCGAGTTTTGGSASSGAGASSSSARVSAAPSNPSSFPGIKESALPAEAKKTLALIRKGGPFPYERDGIHFGNYEKALPAKKGSYYKEYTVKTPGDSSRGPRRIIVGNGQEKYYTPDHYATFTFIEEGK